MLLLPGVCGIDGGAAVSSAGGGSGICAGVSVLSGFMLFEGTAIGELGNYLCSCAVLFDGSAGIPAAGTTFSSPESCSVSVSGDCCGTG